MNTKKTMSVLLIVLMSQSLLLQAGMSGLLCGYWRGFNTRPCNVSEDFFVGGCLKVSNGAVVELYAADDQRCKERDVERQQNLDRVLLDTIGSNSLHISNGGDGYYCGSLFHLIALVSLILKNGAQVNAANEHGSTALMIAAEDWSEPLVRLLLERGASVDSVDQYGRTALIRSVQFGLSRSIINSLLINSGAKICYTTSLSDGSLKTFNAIELAEDKGHKELACYLEEASCYLRETDEA